MQENIATPKSKTNAIIKRSRSPLGLKSPKPTVAKLVKKK